VFSQTDRDKSGKRREAGLFILVPLLAFGGLLLGIGLQNAGVITDAADFYWGSVAASLVLAFLALIKPRKDIVSLCAPMFALFVFIVPLETKPSLLLQGLYAASITALAVRLHLRFSTPKIPDRKEMTMEKYLYEYIHRITPFFPKVGRDCAHDIASTVLSFKFGLYAKAATDAARAISRLGETENRVVLEKALKIVKDRAEALDQSMPGGFSPVSFEKEDFPFLALNIDPGQVEDTHVYTLDNALLLLYAVAYLQSPDDGQSLDEHQNFVIQILEDYRNLIGPK
jgi:hypothetical protein